MDKITLLEWCKDPLNRIKLMEDIIAVFQLKLSTTIWQFCCPTIKELIYYNPAYSHIARYRIFATYKESPGDKAYVYLHDILPELVPYKDMNYGSGLVWFTSYTTRLKALDAAIQDIKNNL